MKLTMRQIKLNDYIAPFKFLVKAAFMSVFHKGFQLTVWENINGEMVISAASNRDSCWLLISPKGGDPRRYLYHG